MAGFQILLLVIYQVKFRFMARCKFMSWAAFHIKDKINVKANVGFRIWISETGSLMGKSRSVTMG